MKRPILLDDFPTKHGDVPVRKVLNHHYNLVKKSICFQGMPDMFNIFGAEHHWILLELAKPHVLFPIGDALRLKLRKMNVESNVNKSAETDGINPENSEVYWGKKST